MTETVVIGAIAAAGLAAAPGVLVWSRVRGYRRALKHSTAEEAYSPARYRPLVRLLESGDEEFLRRHVGCPQVAAQWQRSQRRIARLYLRELAGDFQRMHREARTLVAQSPAQYAELVPLLFRQQMAFWRALTLIELRLALGGTGIPKVRAEALVGTLERMRSEITRAAAMA